MNIVLIILYYNRATWWNRRNIKAENISRSVSWSYCNWRCQSICSRSRSAMWN